MAYGTNSSGNAGQVAIDRFAEMMIARMEQMKASDWKKGWIGGASGFAGLPQNVGGRNYSGSNSFFLQLQTAAQGRAADRSPGLPAAGVPHLQAGAQLESPCTER